jgi:hypothetical protein
VTEAGVYTLAPQSKKVAESLQNDLQMTAFVEGGQDPQLESLLESYQYAGPHVKFRLVDPDKEPTLVEPDEDHRAPERAPPVRERVVRRHESLEEAITNGVIRVTGTTKRVIYFTDGHGEADLQNQQDAKGYANAKLALEQENYDGQEPRRARADPRRRERRRRRGSRAAPLPEEIATLDGLAEARRAASS